MAMNDHSVITEVHYRTPPRAGRPTKHVVVAQCTTCGWKDSLSWIWSADVASTREKLVAHHDNIIFDQERQAS